MIHPNRRGKSVALALAIAMAQAAAAAGPPAPEVKPPRNKETFTQRRKAEAMRRKSR